MGIYAIVAVTGLQLIASCHDLVTLFPGGQVWKYEPA